MVTAAMIRGAGLGFRRSLIRQLDEAGDLTPVSFLELAPENWIGVGGALAKQLRRYSERFPILAHGLSLSLGGFAPLDTRLLDDIAVFLERYRIPIYSEHLSYCSDNGHLYDLMPIPFTDEAVYHVASRIRQVQEHLGRRIAVENVSYYTPLSTELSELEFVRAVLEEADCELLLDVNNVFVNSINHGYDPVGFIRALPAQRISYIHIAGHDDEIPDLLVDTHGAPVASPVWGLLDVAYRHAGIKPTLLERDFNFPPLTELLAELAIIAEHQRRAASPESKPVPEAGA